MAENFEWSRLVLRQKHSKCSQQKMFPARKKPQHLLNIFKWKIGAMKESIMALRALLGHHVLARLLPQGSPHLPTAQDPTEVPAAPRPPCSGCQTLLGSTHRSRSLTPRSCPGCPGKMAASQGCFHFCKNIPQTNLFAVVFFLIHKYLFKT